ncbi:MAG: hypothetical protein DRI57_16005 [Deltaproteobacteria bacterium]|nr:MAG: hypothetical protein DRI57_16005 [Deltaproteobacteria bacterium]
MRACKIPNKPEQDDKDFHISVKIRVIPSPQRLKEYDMLLAELEMRFIRPLPVSDKLQLIADITKMLQEERPEKYFERGVTYPVMTPTVTPDDTSYKGAYRLQQLWEESDNV